MPWNKLDGSQVGPGNRQYGVPPHYPPYQQPPFQPAEAQKQPGKKRLGLRVILSVLLMVATVAFFPDIPAAVVIVCGIIYYCIFHFVLLPDKKVPSPVAAEPEKAPHEQETVEPEPEKELSEVEKIVNEGRLYLEGIRKVNDRIASNSPEAFRQIARMEECAEKIFDYISENPEDAPQIRKFMNYYLPTLLKLLNSYDRLKQQGIDGDHINASITEIEGILHTMAIAFEKQLDNLFQDDQLDISTDIEVLRQILAQEGLADDDMKMSAKEE
ncbi:MAG: 5-bromo-4-chloroindolyl phosphate hydrolysis family protein [Massiliimalia sp.]|jgi:5-bromo-4-chloroindolyl phosphate hydrolysis protein